MSARGLAVMLLIAGCEPGFPHPPEDCRVGESVVVAHVPPPDRLDLMIVVDTHAAPSGSREVVAVRLSEIARVLVTGDVGADGRLDFTPSSDLVLTIAAAEPGCGSPASITWRTSAGAPGDADALVAELAGAIEALPECARSAPLETASAQVARPGPLREHASAILLLVADEDEPDAALHAETLADLLDDSPTSRGSISVIAGFDVARAPLGTREWDGWRAAGGCSAPPLAASGASGLVDALETLWERGITTSLSSICAASWLSALDDGLPWWPERTPCLCLTRPTAVAGEQLACTLTEQLHPSGYHERCADLPGRDTAPLGELDGFERCLVLPSDGESAGWLARPAGESLACLGACRSGDTAFEWIGAEPEPGAELELRCISIGPSPGCDAAP